MTNPIIAMLENTKDHRFHPILFLFNPLPGGGGPDRHKSKGHHTAGFGTREDAEKSVNEDLVPSVRENYGEPKLCLEKVFHWDGVGVPAMVVFFGEVDGKVVPMF
jgi:hypothetical protein